MFLVIVQVKQNIIFNIYFLCASWYGVFEVTIISNIILAQLLTNKIRPKHFAIAADNMMPVKVGCYGLICICCLIFLTQTQVLLPVFVKTFPGHLQRCAP